MFRKTVAALLFMLACSVTLYAEAAEEAPAPRAAEGDKKPDAPGGKFGGKFGDKFGGKFGGKMDPEKLKELKEKLKNVDPEKRKEFKDKFGGKLDPEKLKALKEKFKKD